MKFNLSGAPTFVATGASLGETPLVEVQAERVGGFVRVSVRDNGTGISEAFLKRVSGVFEGEKPAQGCTGAGIGLAIVQRGAERMGGRCGVESAADKGSRFWIDLRGA